MAQFKIKGVRRETSEDVSVALEADSAANASVKAELQGIIVTEVIEASSVSPDPAGIGENPLVAPAEEDSSVPEDQLWTGGPSQWLGIQSYLLGVCVGAAIVWAAILSQYMVLLWGMVPLLVAMAIQYLRIRCTRYSITSERLTIVTGILSRHIQELELFRVKDSELLRPFVLRLLGLGIVKLVTTDASTPVVFLRAISGSIELRELIRTHVNVMRQRRGVRELDVE